MKFVIAVVMLAFASAQAGVLPAVVDSTAWGVPAWGAHGGWGAHAAWAPHAAWGAHAHSWGAAPWASPVALPSLTTWGSPINHWNAAHIDAHSVVAPAVLGHHGHDGQYVAANRGSVHVAPLVGHIQSVSSSNLQPAPGTNW